MTSRHNPELQGLRDIVGSANNGGIYVPTREEFDTEEEYDFAMEIAARSHLWRVSMREADWEQAVAATGEESG